MCIPKLQGFYEEYGQVDDFIKLKTCKDLRDLPDRIKTVEKQNGITHLHEKNTKLWCRFLKLVKEYRNFLIHPFPSPERFHEINDRIFKTKLKDYSNTATEVIQHFYSEGNTEPPAWLEQNRLFFFKSVKLLENG